MFEKTSAAFEGSPILPKLLELVCNQKTGT